MVRRLPIGLVAAFLVGFLLVGLPQWSPGARVGLGDPAVEAGLAGLAVVAMMLIVGQMAGPFRAWTVMALCLPAATVARLAASAGDLRPVEIGIALAVGGAAVAPGILAGQLVQRLQGRARVN